MKSLTFITISFNSGAVIERCHGSMFSTLNDNACVIVDNSSSDGSAERLRRRFPECAVIGLDQNIGYGRGANVALRQVNTKYALLINPDLQLGAEQVEQLVNKAEQHPNGAIFAPATQAKHRQLGTNPIQQDFIHGSCMLFNVERIREIGFFDENIFLFSEETDLCKRCADAGWELLLFPEIYAEHLKGESSGSSKALTYMRGWHFAWSRSYFNHKHGLDRGKHSLKRRLFVYWYKSLIATSPQKRIKYRAHLAGTQAFKNGEAAFNPDGTAKASFQCPLNPYAV